MLEPLKIDVWSDVACPWCYIGKRKLERGLDLLAEDGEAAPVQIEFHSFELMPETPVDFDGSATDLLVRTKGLQPAQVQRMHAQVTAIAAEVGLEYDFTAQRPTNTRKAHQLLHLAKAGEVQGELKERLMRAHFVEGRHIGDDDELVQIATDVGLDAALIRTTLAEGTYLDAVDADIATAHRLGINGVPFFVLDGRYGISGAQAPETFARTISQVLAEREDGSAA